MDKQNQAVMQWNNYSQKWDRVTGQTIYHVHKINLYDPQTGEHDLYSVTRGEWSSYHMQYCDFQRAWYKV